jgi:hypothetical protein
MCNHFVQCTDVGRPFGGRLSAENGRFFAGGRKVLITVVIIFFCLPAAFRRAVQLNPVYAYPYYNLACMLSLLAGEGY